MAARLYAAMAEFRHILEGGERSLSYVTRLAGPRLILLAVAGTSDLIRFLPGFAAIRRQAPALALSLNLRILEVHGCPAVGQGYKGPDGAIRIRV